MADVVAGREGRGQARGGAGSGGREATGAARHQASGAQAKEQWQEDGERADQVYYHVPGAGNPDRTDPPMLDGKPLPKVKAKKNNAAGKRHS